MPKGRVLVTQVKAGRRMPGVRSDLSADCEEFRRRAQTSQMAAEAAR
jgi:hypothetical protein